MISLPEIQFRNAIQHLFKQSLKWRENSKSTDFLARNAIQKCNSASIQAKSKIERKFQEYSEKTLKFERIPRELWEKSERTLKFDFLAKMPCFYTIQHLFKQKSKIEREFFSMINLRKICQKCNSEMQFSIHSSKV